jgi:hypothetical protein
MNHPAPDPFVFDPARIERSEMWKDKYGLESVDVLYTLPGGDKIGITIDARDVSADRDARHGLQMTFYKIVAGLSAHQRMAWAAAAQAEGAAP